MLIGGSWKTLVCKLLVVAGNTLALVGCTGVLLGAAGIIPFDIFAIGLSSGIRVIGSFAIAGCLLSAIGYGYLEFIEK